MFCTSMPTNMSRSYVFRRDLVLPHLPTLHTSHVHDSYSFPDNLTPCDVQDCCFDPSKAEADLNIILHQSPGRTPRRALHVSVTELIQLMMLRTVIVLDPTETKILCMD
jgi:hypothetical protein